MSVFVKPPARVPFPSGLFSVIDFGNETHFPQGIEWEGIVSAQVSGISSYFEACAASAAPSGLPKVFDNTNDTGEANSFTVYGSYLCSPVGYTIEHASEMAEQALEIREQSRVEQALWTGDLGNVPNFSDAASNGAAVSMAEAIADAEKFIQDHFGSVGVIHIPRAEVVYFLNEGLVRVDKETGRIYTALGTPVVAGAGYPNASPITGAAGHWLVATGTLVGQRSEVFIGSSTRGDLLDRGKNDLYGIAERTYSIGYDDETALAVNFTVS